MAVEEGFELGVVTKESVKHLVRGECCCHREIAAGESLGETEVVRLYALVVARKKTVCGPAQPGHHLVGDELNAVPPGDSGDPAQPSHRLRDHPGRALQPRLEEHCGVVAAPFFAGGKPLLDLVNAFELALAGVACVVAFRLGLVERAAVAVRRHDLVRLEEHPGVCLVEQVDVTCADRANCVSVVRAVE